MVSTSTYQYTNPHPKKSKKMGDCTIRAISIATGKSWLEVYDELASIGRELLAPQNDMTVINYYMERIGTKIPVKVDGKRLTAYDLCQLRGSKTYIIRTAGHLACVKNKKLRDTWDSSHKSGYIVWQIN